MRRTQQRAAVAAGGQEDGPSHSELPRRRQVHGAEGDGVVGQGLIVGDPDALRRASTGMSTYGLHYLIGLKVKN